MKRVKKIKVYPLTMLVAILIGGFANSQVGFGTRAPAGKNPDSTVITSPQGILHLQGSHYYGENADSTAVLRNVGLVVPRIDGSSIDPDDKNLNVVTPDGSSAVEGTMVFQKQKSVTVIDGDGDSHTYITGGCLRVKTAEGANGWDGLFADCLVDASKNSSANTIDAYEGLPVRVKKVSAGYAFSLVISADDDMVYAAGYNNLGRTGLGTVTGNTASFRMPLARTVTDISAGYTHALAIDHTGSIWSWGNGANYRTGQPSTGTFTFPRKILNFPPKGVKAVRVEGGYTNSLVLCDDGKVYAFGANTSGLNGNGTTSGNVQVPTVIGALTHIKDIALSQLSAVAVDSTGNVWVWGNQANGRLGNGATASATVIPTKITFPKPIKQVAMGSNHGIAVSEDGITLYGWGAGQGWGSAVGGLTGTGSATATATSPSPIDITDFLVNVTKKDQIAKEARFSLATDTIVYVAASRFEAAGAAVGGTLVVTNRNVYGAGSSATAPLLGLGTFQRTGAAPVAKYSPENVGTGAAAVYFRGFYPVYEGAMYEGIRFSQASMSGGTGNYPHSLLAQELTGATTSGSGVTTAQSGGYGYGTGAVYYRQLGAVDPTYTPIYIFTMLKK